MTWNYLICLFLKVTVHFLSFALRGHLSSQSVVSDEAHMVSSSSANERSHLQMVHSTATNVPASPNLTLRCSQMQVVPLYIHAVTH